MRAKNPEKARRYVNKTQVKARLIIRDSKDKPCADCGVQYPFYVMQFDHLRDKMMNIATKGASASRAKLLAEIEKCEVVCANCHAERTYRRIQQAFQPQLN